MQDDINKFLTEAMGEYKEPRWRVAQKYEAHRYALIKYTTRRRGTKEKCEKYIKKHYNANASFPLELKISKTRITDYSTAKGFFKLWEWSIEQEWWDTFLIDNGRYNDNCEIFINENLINPEEFAKAVAEYLKQNIH